MKKSLISLTTGFLLLPNLSFAESSRYFSLKEGDGFKRFSISAGWLQALPQGKANNVHVNTSAKNGTYKTGDVNIQTVTDAIANTPEGDAAKKRLLKLVKIGQNVGLIKDTLPAFISGNTTINSLENWENQGTGMEADNVHTLGLLFNYYFTDHLSLEIKAGVPPKVNIKGQGQIYAPIQGIATPQIGLTGKPALDRPIQGINNTISSLGAIPLDTQIYITDLSQGNKAATTRAWLPAVELQYQFGKSGVNKFRPYIGVGVFYSYFNQTKLNSGIEADLIVAGHRIQNILDGKAGTSLEGKASSADPSVKLKTTDTLSPVATLGATYDLNDKWFAVGSVSYSKMNTESKIKVTDNITGRELINATSKIDVDPIITYLGVGYRF